MSELCPLYGLGASSGTIIMVDEDKEAKKDTDKEDPKAEDKAEAKGPQDKKSDLLTYVIVGVGALVVTVGVMLALGDSWTGKASDAEESDASASSENNAEHSAKNMAKGKSERKEPDIFSELEDLSFLDEDQALNDAAEKNLNQKKSPGDKKGGSMTLGESLATVNWLEAEKSKLKSERAELKKMKSQLAVQEKTIDKKLRQLNQAEATKLNALAKLYDGMKADQVARMIVKLDDKTIVSILPRMKPANASKILGLMAPARGARISKRMITLADK